MPNRSVTHRGFVSYDELTDAYGASITVRESSAASAPHVWLFIEGGGTAAAPGTPGIPGGRVNDGSAHLTVAQAVRVRDALDNFIHEHEGELA